MITKDTYKSKFFDDKDLARLLADNPQLKKGDPDKYCPTCFKRGQYLRYGEWHPCDCQQQLHLHMHYLHAGIGGTYQQLDWSDYHGTTDVAELVDSYVGNHEAYIQRGVGLWLYGDFGTGKTMIANLMLKEFVKRGYTCFATTLAKTIDMYTAGWKEPKERRWFERRFELSQVLLLDDVGKDLLGTTILSESTFDSLLRTRVQHNRPTFITTNLAENMIRRNYGAAALSLLKEKSVYVEFEGQDYRPTARSREDAEIKAAEVRPVV